MAESSVIEEICEACIVCGHLMLTEVLKCSECKACLHSKCANIKEEEDGQKLKLCDNCHNKDGCKLQYYFINV